MMTKNREAKLLAEIEAWKNVHLAWQAMHDFSYWNDDVDCDEEEEEEDGEVSLADRKVLLGSNINDALRIASELSNPAVVEPVKDSGLVREHCIESDGSGTVKLYAEDDEGGFVIAVPSHRLGALVLAVLDAKDGKETRR